LDLTGLPPTPAEVAAFVADKSPKAWEKVVERLLASEHYGERWGQHWLDVVRFAETEGYEYDNFRPDAWRYRDYVIRAFNNDKPYDRFIQEQLAGDEIGPSEDETLIAAGFNRLGPVRRNAGNQAVASSRNEQLTEMTNIVGAGVMGVTLGCARCHDHKFDGFRQSDYYRVQAFFSAVQPDDLSKASPDEQAAWKVKAAPVQAEVATLTREINARIKAKQPVIELQEKLEVLQDKMPPALPSLFTIKDDFTQKAQIHLLPRGDFEHPGDAVGMRVPGVFLPDDAPEVDDTVAKPREYLAKWLTDAANPLTARVMVNRIWHYHFGRGIVATPNDFGRMGEKPLNPELLDFLANEFVASGYSVKHMHRLILASNTYRQTSVAPQAVIEKDPDGRFLERFPRLRLEAEQIRDGMLHVSGLMNTKTGGPGVMIPLDKGLVQALYKPSQWVPAKDPAEYNRRTIYLIYKRNLALPFMQTFDAPDMAGSCPRREASTHAPQALEMLNGDIATHAAKAFAERLLREAGTDHRRQVDLAYRLAASRAPKPSELALALKYLAQDDEAKSREQFALAMFNLNAFLYVN
ncbi:MAG: hypothetical protein JWN34_1584, partial [Bryobacterales bacterium]|nr:hypothetical protein [Bryobacterales bacterium]